MRADQIAQSLVEAWLAVPQNERKLSKLVSRIAGEIAKKDAEVMRLRSLLAMSGIDATEKLRGGI